jgi:hypothetical protein
MPDRANGGDEPPVSNLLTSLEKVVRDYSSRTERQHLKPALKDLRSAVDQLRMAAFDLSLAGDSLEAAANSIEKMVGDSERKAAAKAKDGKQRRSRQSGFAAELMKQPTWVDRVAVTLVRFGPQTEKAILERIRKHWDGGEVKESTISSCLQKLKSMHLAKPREDHRWFLLVKGRWRGWGHYRSSNRDGKAAGGRRSG